MPRRLPVKPERVVGNLFIILVFVALTYVYFSVVWIVLAPKIGNGWWNGIEELTLAFYHFFLILLLWSLVQTIFWDPGQVPTFWGFHFGDHESKRKRYWLIWNVFKPERWHHWSTCNRCVLNMDHHCPWVNNWIGFWNRKPFILLLVYVLLCAYLSFIILSFDLFYRIQNEYALYKRGTTEYNGYAKLLIVIGGEVITGAASFMMTNFLKFHINLILENKTTIEFLEK